MAITLLSSNISNDDHVSAYRPAEFTLQSDDANISRLVLYVKTGGNTIKTIVQEPDLGTTDEFTFDLSEAMQEQLSYDLLDSGTGNLAASNSMIQFTYDGKELVESSGLLVDGATSIPAGEIRTFYGHNAVLQHPSLQTGTAITDFSNYLMDTAGQSRLFLTSAPTKSGKRYFTTEDDEYLYVQAIIDADSVNRIEVQTISAAGTVVNTYTVSLAYAGWQRLNINLSMAYWTSIFAGFGTDFSSGNATTYQLRMRDNGGNTYSETFKVYVVSKCSPERIRFHFLNQWGAFDAMTFYGKPVTMQTAKGGTYEQLINSDFTAVNTEDRGVTTLNVQSGKRVKCVAPNLTTDEKAWLAELERSPEVYIETGTEVLPVNIRHGRSTVIDRRTTIHRVEIEFEYSNEYVTQRN